MKNVKEFVKPKTLAEGAEIFKSKKSNVQYMSGGTSHRLHPNEKLETVIDIKSLLGTQITEKNGEIAIGAGVSMQDLYESPCFQSQEVKCVSMAAKTVAGPGLRNQITLGGNTVIKYPWSNMPVALLVLDAKFKFANGKTLSADEFLTQPKGKSIEDSDIMTDVIVSPEKGLKTFWQRFGYNENDIPIMNFAMSLSITGNKADKVKIAVGALTALPTRMTNAENYLKSGFDKTKLYQDLGTAIEKDVASMKFINDIRCDNEYQRNLTLNSVRRAIIDALN